MVGKSIEQEILVTSTAAPMGRQGSEQPSSVGAVLGGPDWISARPDAALALLAHMRAMKDLADDMTHAALTPLLGRKLFAPLGDDQNGAPLSAVSAFVAARCRPLWPPNRGREPPVCPTIGDHPAGRIELNRSEVTTTHESGSSDPSDRNPPPHTVEKLEK